MKNIISWLMPIGKPPEQKYPASAENKTVKFQTDKVLKIKNDIVEAKKLFQRFYTVNVD